MIITKHRSIGSERNPLMAGNPVRLECEAGTALHGGEITYALFRLDADSIVAPPVFVLSTTDGGILVTSAAAGLYSVLLTQSHTAMWSGRDWHACRYLTFDLFDGLVVSTRALSW